MTETNTFTEKSKTSKQAYASGETVATTLRIPPELRIEWFHEVGNRMLQSKVGVGWKQTPSSQQIVVEDLAYGLGVELPQEILKKPEHEESGVIRYMINLPKIIHEKIKLRAEANKDSFNNVALNLLKSKSCERKQQNQLAINNGIVSIKVTLTEDVYNYCKQKAFMENITIESYIAETIENQIPKKKPSFKM